MYRIGLVIAAKKSHNSGETDIPRRVISGEFFGPVVCIGLTSGIALNLSLFWLTLSSYSINWLSYFIVSACLGSAFSYVSTIPSLVGDYDWGVQPQRMNCWILALFIKQMFIGFLGIGGLIILAFMFYDPNSKNNFVYSFISDYYSLFGLFYWKYSSELLSALMVLGVILYPTIRLKAIYDHYDFPIAGIALKFTLSAMVAMGLASMLIYGLRLGIGSWSGNYLQTLLFFLLWPLVYQGFQLGWQKLKH